MVRAIGWHALSHRRAWNPITNDHALPDGQGRATHASKLSSIRTSRQPCEIRRLSGLTEISADLTKAKVVRELLA